MQELYSLEILRLAANISCLGKLETPTATISAVSRTCGAKIEVGIRLECGRVAAFAQEIRSCILGQAAASILATNVLGASVEELQEASENLGQMLRNRILPPEGRFWELRALLPVQDYPSRHDAALLPFKAAAEAACAAFRVLDKETKAS